jgi:acyl-CoA reductase-like NAD-dependent aldehyde dehydrogenase
MLTVLVGLAAAVHTTNLNTAIRVSNAIRAGYVATFRMSSMLLTEL